MDGLHARQKTKAMAMVMVMVIGFKLIVGGVLHPPLTISLRRLRRRGRVEAVAFAK